jgi:hypothetical protein
MPSSTMLKPCEYLGRWRKVVFVFLVRMVCACVGGAAVFVVGQERALHGPRIPEDARRARLRRREQERSRGV